MSERVGLAELETNERKALANAVQALEENRFPSRVDWQGGRDQSGESVRLR